MAPDRIILIVGADLDPGHLRRLSEMCRMPRVMLVTAPAPDDTSTGCFAPITYATASSLGNEFNLGNFTNSSFIHDMVETCRGGFRALSSAEKMRDLEATRVALEKWRRVYRKPILPKCMMPHSPHRFRPIHQPRWGAKRWRSTT